jgi:hypothetical protein
MKAYRWLFASIIAGLLATSGPSPAASHPTAGPQSLSQQAGKVRIPFIENLGQVPGEEVAFYAKLFSGTLFVTRDAALVYSLGDKDLAGHPIAWAFRESFAGGASAGPKGDEPSTARVSYFKDTTPEGRRHPPTFARVDLGEVYPGIRIDLRASGANVEKRFHVSPGARVEDISVTIDGAADARIDPVGRLRLETDKGSIAFSAPRGYQEIDGERRPVEVAYTLADNHYGFRLGRHDPAFEVVIDPLLASTYLGGANGNPAWNGNYDRDIAYSILSTGDSVYVGGVTQSTDFPVTLGYDETPDANGRPDGFIARFSNDLSSLYSATYFGTDYFDRVQAIALDTDGGVVAVGQAGYGFPVTPGAYSYQDGEPVGGGFISKFSADLSTLLASAVVTPSDYPLQVAVGNGAIYFGGTTNNPNFPITPNAFRSTCCPAGGFGIREYDGFAGKISSDLSTLLSLTYLGGDVVTGIAIAEDSSVYISDGSDNSITGYLNHFDSDLSTRFTQIAYYPGTRSGSSRHYFKDVAVGDGFVIAVGQTYLNDLPVTAGAFDTACGSDGDCDNFSPILYIPKPDGFVARYSLDLQTVEAMTYFGGEEADAIRAVDLDSSGDVYVTGETLSPDMPTTGGTRDHRCGTVSTCSGDVFLAKFSGDLSQLLYGTYLGGSAEDLGLDLSVATEDRTYVAGMTESADFPTTKRAFDRSYAGGSSGTYDSDAFISLLDTRTGGDNQAPIADAGNDRSVKQRTLVSLDGHGSSDPDGEIVRYRWTQVTGRPVRLADAHSALADFLAPRVWLRRRKTLVFELTVTDDRGATDTDRVSVNVSR